MDYQINDLIYHKSFGFGYVTYIDGEALEIQFKNFTKNIAKSFEMKIIGKKLIEKVYDRNSPLFDYSDNLKQEALKYCQNNQVHALNVSDNLMSFSVDNHTVIINLKRDEASCTCSGTKCKHIAGAMEYLYEAFTFIKPAFTMDKYNEVKTLKTQIKKLIEDYSIQEEYGEILQIVNLVEVVPAIDICQLILFCYKTVRDKFVLEKLIAAFFYSDKLNPKMVSIRFSNIFNRTQMLYLDNLFNKYYSRKKLSKTDFGGKALFFLVNKQYDQFMQFMISSRNRFIRDFEKVIKFIDFSACKLDTMEYMSINSPYSDFVRKYVDLTTEDIKIAIDNNWPLPYTSDDLIKLDNDYIFKALTSGILSREFAFKFICDNKARLMVDDKKYVYAISFNAIESSRNKNTLNKVFSGINDAIYVQRLLLSYRFNLSTIVDRDPCIKPDMFIKYFDYKYSVKYEEDVIQITYHFTFFYYRLDIIVKNNEVIDLYEDDLDNSQILADYLYSLNKADIDQKIAAEKRKQAEKIEKENQKFLNDLIDKASPLMIQDLHSYSENKKARLELHFDEGLNIKMKIGIDKLYVIKDLDEFVELFFNKGTKTYGKSFTFTHLTSNMAKPYDKLMEYILEITYRQFKEHYYYTDVEYLVDINSLNLKHFFEILKGEYVYIHGVYTKINLDLIKGNAYIDENYHMHIGFPDDYQYIIFEDSIYVIHDKLMDVLDADANKVKLYQFILNIKDKSIEPVLNRFKNEIYYHFEDSISVADDVKKDFKIEKLRCELYFDYNDKTLSVEDKYFINDKQVSKKEITSFKDEVVYDHIQNILNELGFVDNECTSEGKILEFFNLNFETIKKSASVFLSDSIQNKMVIKFTPPQLKINYDCSMFNAFYEESNFTDDELNNIYKALKRKKKYIILSDDRIIDLSEEQSQDYLRTIDEFRLDPEKPQAPVNIPVYKALEAQALVKNVEVSDYVKTIIEEIKNYKTYNLETPKINAKLRDYQVEGYHWLSILAKHNLAGILADDMGLGKTIQIIALINEFKTNLPSLIACPKSLVFNWINEFRRFAPNINVCEIYGGQGERRNIIANIKKDSNTIYVTSYDSLSRDLDYYQNEFEFFIIDEAQAIKNSQTNKSKSVKHIKSRTRFALTGTPIENSVLDLWSIFDFLMPDYFDSVEIFKRRYLNENNYQDRIIKKISPFVLRRTKKDVLDDLPEKYERVYSVDMNADQRKIYDSFCLKAKDMIVSGEKVFSMLPMLTRLRQICVAPSMFLEGDYSSGKIDALKQILTDYSDHKILIFSSFVKAINILEDYFSSNNIKYYVITGDTNAKERIRLCNEFNNNDVKIFLISLKAGGFGLNLTGADTIIHLDPWWNLSAENQASDRAHRIGQKKNVEVIKLVCTNSIEQRVIELQNLKKDIFDKLISSNDERITSLTIEDLNFILN